MAHVRAAVVSLALLAACGHGAAAPRASDVSGGSLDGGSGVQSGEGAPLSGDGDAAAEGAAGDVDAAAVAASDTRDASTNAPATSAPDIVSTTNVSYRTASLKTAFVANGEKLRACYDAGKKRDPRLRGKVILKFTIGGDGKPKTVADEGSTLKDADAIACVVNVVKAIRFAKAEGNVTIVYPFIFHPTVDRKDELILPESAAPPSPPPPR